jgi:hypothetical protein
MDEWKGSLTMDVQQRTPHPMIRTLSFDPERFRRRIDTDPAPPSGCGRRGGHPALEPRFTRRRSDRRAPGVSSYAVGRATLTHVNLL